MTPLPLVPRVAGRLHAVSGQRPVLLRSSPGPAADRGFSYSVAIAMAYSDGKTLPRRSPLIASATRRSFVKGLGGFALLVGTAGPAGAQTAAGEVAPGTVRLDAAPAKVRLHPKAPGTAELWSFTGDAAGARLQARLGQPLALQLANRLPQPVSMPILGLPADNVLDGAVPLAGEAVPPGEERTITLAPGRPGTFLLRPGSLAYAAEQTARGLYGTLVVPEPQPLAVDEDVTIILSDWALDPSGTLRAGTVEAAGAAGQLGNWVTVNGTEASAATLQTITLPRRGRARLRLVNTATARRFILRFDAMDTMVIAVDSIATEPFAPARGALPLLPGGRLDVVVTPREGAVIRHLLGQQAEPLLAFSAGASTSPHADAPPPALPAPDMPVAIDLAAARRADAKISGGLDPTNPTAGIDATRIWQINGAAFPDQREPLLRIPRGKPAVLAFTNETAHVQILHVHGHSVRLLHPLDDGWEPYWVDTFAVPQGRTVRIAFVAERPGRWLIGSAVLDKLAAGLAAWYEVT